MKSHSLQNVVHFTLVESVSKDHLLSESTYLWPQRQSFKIGFTVQQNITLFCHIEGELAGFSVQLFPMFYC